MKMFRCSLLLLCLACVPAAAQKIGLGVGLAASNDKISQLTSDLASNGLSNVSSDARNGYYVELRARFGGDLALVGGLAYLHFAQTSTSYQDGSGNTITAQTSQSVMPISVGVEQRFPIGLIKPYVSLEGTYSSYHRSFDPQGGSTLESEFPSTSSTDPRYGLAIGAGVDFDLMLVDLSVGARYQMINLLNKDANEAAVNILQVGIVASLGL